MKLTIDPNLKGKALYKYLIANKAQLIAQKKSLPKYADAISHAVDYFIPKDGLATKGTVGDIPLDATSLSVKLIANTANWCDSHMDVLLPDCWAKTIKEGHGRIHLHDHIYRLDAQVGDVTNIYSQNISLNELGISKTGTTQCLIYESQVQKAYNEFVFNLYKTGKVLQHSIGMFYLKMELAINDEESEKEFDFWNKHVHQVINQDFVNERGYFWVVPEIKLLENSSVLFGSNELTPTLDVKTGTGILPLTGTENQPPTGSTVNIKSLLNCFN